MQTDSERELLFDDYSGVLGRKILKKVYQQALNSNIDDEGDSRGYLLIKNFKTNPNNKRYWACMENYFEFPDLNDSD